MDLFKTSPETPLQKTRKDARRKEKQEIRYYQLPANGSLLFERPRPSNGLKETSSLQEGYTVQHDSGMKERGFCVCVFPETVRLTCIEC